MLGRLRKQHGLWVHGLGRRGGPSEIRTCCWQQARHEKSGSLRFRKWWTSFSVRATRPGTTIAPLLQLLDETLAVQRCAESLKSMMCIPRTRATGGVQHLANKRITQNPQQVSCKLNSLKPLPADKIRRSTRLAETSLDGCAAAAFEMGAKCKSKQMLQMRKFPSCRYQRRGGPLHHQHTPVMGMARRYKWP